MYKEISGYRALMVAPEKDFETLKLFVNVLYQLDVQGWFEFLRTLTDHIKIENDMRDYDPFSISPAHLTELQTYCRK